MDGHGVGGLDNLSDYCDSALKRGQVDQLAPHDGFIFERLDIASLIARRWRRCSGATARPASCTSPPQAGVR